MQRRRCTSWCCLPEKSGTTRARKEEAENAAGQTLFPSEFIGSIWHFNGWLQESCYNITMSQGSVVKPQQLHSHTDAWLEGLALMESCPDGVHRKPVLLVCRQKPDLHSADWSALKLIMNATSSLLRAGLCTALISQSYVSHRGLVQLSIRLWILITNHHLLDCEQKPKPAKTHAFFFPFPSNSMHLGHPDLSTV